MRRIIFTAALAVAVMLASSACTPAQVQRWFAAQGTTIDQPTAAYIARALDIWAAQNAALLAYLQAVAPTTCSDPGSCARLVRGVFDRAGIGWRGDEAVRVMMCESGGNPRATNGSHDGLFQQARQYWPARAAAAGVGGRSAFDPWANAVVSAGMVRADGGWRQWSCRP